MVVVGACVCIYLDTAYFVLNKELHLFLFKNQFFSLCTNLGNNKYSYITIIDSRGVFASVLFSEGDNDARDIVSATTQISLIDKGRGDSK